MTNQNLWNDYAGLTDKTRIHKPPGGDTNDIFGLEERQKQQGLKPQPSNDFNKEEKDSFQSDTTKSEVPLPKVVPEYQGITDLTRVRKPPGGDTNDIFGMEKRQKTFSDEQALAKEVCMINIESSDPCDMTATDVKPFQSLKGSHVDTSHHSPQAFELDKENADVLLGKDNPRYGNQEDNFGAMQAKLKGKQFHGDTDQNESKKYFRHNPITGEVSEVEISISSKLADCSNRIAGQDRLQDPKEIPSHRPSIRVRQPPGGASGNIF